MTSNEHGLDLYLRRLESLVDNPPAERHREDILRFLNTFSETAETSGMTEKEKTRIESRALHLLYAALSRTEDEELRSFYYECFASFGMRGVPMLLAHLSHCAAEGSGNKTLAAFPAEIRAMTVNQILSEPTAAPEALKEIALNELPRLKEMKPLPTAYTLAGISRYEDELAFAVQEVLKEGMFWQSALQNLEDRISDKESLPSPGDEELLESLSLFRGPALRAMLPKLFEPGRSLSPKVLLQAARRLASAPNLDITRAVGRLLMHEDEETARSALETLTALAPQDLGRIFAALLRKNNRLKSDVLRLTPLLSRREFMTLREALQENSLNDLELRTFLACSLVDPWEAHSCLQDAFNSGDYEEPAFDDLQRILHVEQETPNFSQRLQSVEGKPVRAIRVDERPFQGEEHGSGNETGRRRILKDQNYKGALIKENSLQDLEFHRPAFSDGGFADCSLENVFFLYADFSGTVFCNTRFENCVFEHCSFNSCLFTGCEFLECSFMTCDLENTAFVDCRSSMTRTAECAMFACTVHNSHSRACLFQNCDMTWSVWSRSRLLGVEFRSCMLDHARIDRMDLKCTSFPFSLFRDTQVTGLRTDCPRLLEMRRRSYRSSRLDVPEAPSGSPGLRALAAEAMRRWQFRMDVSERRAVFMRNNSRRHRWALHKSGADKSEFFRVAPLLLHTEVFEHEKDIPLLPLTCRIAGYHPKMADITALQRHFRSAQLPDDAQDPVVLHGLYTIGSTGTVSQTSSSDLDFWVCYDPEDMPESMVDGLAYKLEAIEHWAMDTFGVEVHFFLMNLDLIRRNNFGFSDAESSGSAQALLLKEEFYRTAMHVAGKHLVWWAVEPGADSEGHAGMARELADNNLLDAYVDFGGLQDIPAEEFFGASLWQVVKALKSPFKSIMKFGLLESYTSSSAKGETLLLCDVLKRNLLSGRDSLLEADPYVLLFREVVQHYQRQADKESMQMVRLSFALKSALRQQIQRPGPLLLRDDSEVREIFARSDASSPLHLSRVYINQDWPFDKLVSIGALVNKFIVQTYTRVREEQSGLEKVAITPEDLTKLGRKIFSTFAKRRNKIQHIPFISFAETPFKVLHFSATGGKMGEPEAWEIQGAQKISTSERLHLTDLARNESLPKLLAWLIANEIYTPGMLIRGDYSISPVTTRDLEVLLQKLRSFFPTSRTFDTDIGETLNPERVVKAFFIINLIKPREIHSPQEASIVYSTNWGELFCVTAPVRNNDLHEDPMAFLVANVPQSVPEKLSIQSFVPTRSKCPSLDFPSHAPSG